MSAVAVVVAVLRRPDGRVLVAGRDAGRHQGGGLELPGGKIDPGEAPEAALARELDEELGVVPLASERLMRVRHDYGDRTVELDAWLVTDWRGEPRGAEGQALSWLAPAELDAAAFPVANRPLLAALQLPALCRITPDPCDDSAAAVERLVEGVRTAVARGIGLVQLRAPGLAPAALPALAERLLAAASGMRLLVNAPPEIVADLPVAAGLHLTAARAAAVPARPFGPERLLSCSVHDSAGIACAERIGADLAFAGPVRPTASHPDAKAMGWTGLADLAATTTVPLYALGGLYPGDLARARQAGAIGVAGIRGFAGDGSP